MKAGLEKNSHIILSTITPCFLHVTINKRLEKNQINMGKVGAFQATGPTLRESQKCRTAASKINPVEKYSSPPRSSIYLAFNSMILPVSNGQGFKLFNCKVSRKSIHFLTNDRPPCSQSLKKVMRPPQSAICIDILQPIGVYWGPKFWES